MDELRTLWLDCPLQVCRHTHACLLANLFLIARLLAHGTLCIMRVHMLLVPHAKCGYACCLCTWVLAVGMTADLQWTVKPKCSQLIHHNLHTAFTVSTHLSALPMCTRPSALAMSPALHLACHPQPPSLLPPALHAVWLGLALECCKGRAVGQPLAARLLKAI